MKSSIVKKEQEVSFQESAESWKSKAHLSETKPLALVVVGVIAVVVLFFILQGLWGSIQASGIEVQRVEVEEEAFDSSMSSEGVAEGSPSLSLYYVHVGGAVNMPGVYALEEGSRIQAAVDAAGGYREDAAVDAVNLARLVNDGEQIIVPTKEEYIGGLGTNDEGSLQISGKVNINNASSSELMALPGVGEVTAKKIIADREANGPFSAPDDLMRVSGIGEKKYEQLADSICV